MQLKETGILSRWHSCQCNRFLKQVSIDRIPSYLLFIYLSTALRNKKDTVVWHGWLGFYEKVPHGTDQIFLCLISFEGVTMVTSLSFHI